MGRIHGRITKEDIKDACLRRWDGRRRVTTDWVNLFQETELCFSNGDCLVYLREPGKSSRGPSFRIHTSQLVIKGFRNLVEQATPRPLLHSSTSCTIPSCEGCDPSVVKELFLPAPSDGDLESKIDHHLTTRNFFAWLYNKPLVGRALGKSVVDLKQRLDEYKSAKFSQNETELLSYLEHHHYLDFRECIDHALALLYVAEALELEDLWVDAFAHCVGMSHKGLHASLEYPFISESTRAMITRARDDMDIKLYHVSQCVLDFFESELTSSNLGLPHGTREHFDRFRSYLQAFYIEQYGFWPPENIDNDAARQSLYTRLYSDFRNLYHHLVDPGSTPEMTTNLNSTGGVCALQNIQAFDQRRGYDVLPHPLPSCPIVPAVEVPRHGTTSRRSSLNPLRKRQAERELRQELEMQALIDSSNRDWEIMRCLLVRHYSDFEQGSVLDDFEKVSIVDGRKVRWILVYAILQTLISVMQAPKQVRDTEGLSYSLCCQVPEALPWKVTKALPVAARPVSLPEQPHIEPDMDYLRSNLSSQSLKSKAERPASMLSRSSTVASGNTLSADSASSSLRRLFTRRNAASSEKPASVKRPTFCEIFVQGYGNGLNQVYLQSSGACEGEEGKCSREQPFGAEPIKRSTTPPTPTASVSRESSRSSGYSARSSGTGATTPTDEERPEADPLSVKEDSKSTAGGDVEIAYESNRVGSIFFNPETWDKVLGITGDTATVLHVC